jgi:hypothetical protein
MNKMQSKTPWGLTGEFVIDLEWNRKSIFEKLDWLKQVIEDLVEKANHNISAQQEQLRAVAARLSALEKPSRKSTPTTAARSKEPRRTPPRPDKRSPPSKRKR